MNECGIKWNKASFILCNCLNEDLQKNLGFNEIQTHDLCIAGVVLLYQQT